MDRPSEPSTATETARPRCGTPSAAPAPAADIQGHPQPGGGQAGSLVEAVVDLGRLALAFGMVNRTAVYHPDGVTPESDTDHTVMLAWAACSLAARFFPALDLGLCANTA